VASTTSTNYSSKSHQSRSPAPSSLSKGRRSSSPRKKSVSRGLGGSSTSNKASRRAVLSLRRTLERDALRAAIASGRFIAGVSSDSQMEAIKAAAVIGKLPRVEEGNRNQPKERKLKLNAGVEKAVSVKDGEVLVDMNTLIKLVRLPKARGKKVGRDDDMKENEE
jgi:hypothetical protein